MCLFHRSRPACCRWASLDQRGMSWAGQKRYTHLKAHENNIYHVFVFFFLKAWEEFPFSLLFASVSSANNKAKATLPSQDLVSWASLGFSTLSRPTTPCAINLGGFLRIRNLVKLYHSAAQPSWISVSGDWLNLSFLLFDPDSAWVKIAKSFFAGSSFVSLTNI